MTAFQEAAKSTKLQQFDLPSWESITEGLEIFLPMADRHIYDLPYLGPCQAYAIKTLPLDLSFFPVDGRPTAVRNPCDLP